MVEASATTNLSEINADYLRLWQPSARNHVDVRGIFVDKGAIVAPASVETPVGNGETETTLEYDAPSNEQLPGLKGLLDYLERQYPCSAVNKFYTINRKQTMQALGDTHVLVRKSTKQVRNLRVNVETYAPTLLQRTKVTQKVTRPIYIFAAP